MSTVDRERADPHCLSDTEADELLRGAPWQRFVVMGDSLAEGLGEPLDGYAFVPWGDRVADALRRVTPELAYRNVGRRYLRTAEIRNRQLVAALDFAPDLAAVTAGGNDILADDFDPAAVERDLDGIIGPLREAGAEVLTWTMWDIGRAFPELRDTPLLPRVAQLNEVWRAVARRHATLHTEQEGHPVTAERDILSSDLMHASARGHAVVAATTIRRLGEHLRERR